MWHDFLRLFFYKMDEGKVQDGIPSIRKENKNCDIHFQFQDLEFIGYFAELDQLPSMNAEGKWLPITTKFRDLSDESTKPLFAMLSKFYDLGATSFGEMAATGEVERVLGELAPNLGTMKITRHSKLNARQSWLLSGCWPHTIKFGDLCYSDRAETEIEISWRYFKAILCPVEIILDRQAT